MKSEAFERLLSYMKQEEKKGWVNPFPDSWKPTDFSSSLNILQIAAEGKLISPDEYSKARELLLYGEKKIISWKIEARRNTHDMKAYIECMNNLLTKNLAIISTLTELEELDSITLEDNPIKKKKEEDKDDDIFPQKPIVL